MPPECRRHPALKFGGVSVQEIKFGGAENGSLPPLSLILSPLGAGCHLQWLNPSSSQLPPRQQQLASPPFFLYPPPPSPVISKGRDVEDATVGCPVCGVFMQDADPNLPGFFKNPSRLSDDEMGEDWSPLAAELDGFIGNDEGNDVPSESDL
uniref:Uncharacterized protein n=1 Tax=Oryza nivara TaxID=4536 RepID=A0A0E0IT50_ORYNI